MTVNWKVRIKNVNFWITMIPAILVAIQAFAEIFGIKIDLGETGNRLLAFVNALFIVLAGFGIVNDPTTATFSDSKRAMGYDDPA